ncbi:MAG: bifunctional diaminohydroxyphosphoribosylaminopyrimidine deaminase/5-amino-6-(5-phosphoribosylamino)uracil reductase RibD [Chlamydiota bacterium]|nr:bifunctional diaminohydroxyphosphoribosylaminopyrimidine deaminase/5-amino-6-(5-phosphoribosylamino)uracil reductase RibD [Chlamydiota bacterium]
MRHNHDLYMKYAILEAKKGLGKVEPNPPVGAVIVRNNTILAKGYHHHFGGPHAEIDVLEKVKNVDLKGALLYITLEPCCTHGKTPPCTERIIKSGIKNVVIAIKDPNPKHLGKGIRILKKAGIHVETGIMKEEAKLLIKYFEKFITKKLPWCTVKSAMSLDGKIATHTGESKWISNQHSRELVQSLRKTADAILVGINTVLIDDPGLSLRIGKHHKEPYKIVLDSYARIPLNSRLIKSFPEKTIIITNMVETHKKVCLLKKRGVCVIHNKSRKGFIMVREAFNKIAECGIQHVLVEGGGSVINSVFKAGLVDEIVFFYAPILVGGKNAPTSMDGKGIRHLKDAYRIKNLLTENIHGDILIRGNVIYP